MWPPTSSPTFKQKGFGRGKIFSYLSCMIFFILDSCLLVYYLLRMREDPPPFPSPLLFAEKSGQGKIFVLGMGYGVKKQKA